MGENSKIEWTDHTFNAWVGCEKISPECKHCYAEISTIARVSKSRGLPLWGPGSTRHRTASGNWKLPLKWNRRAAADGVRRRVFCSSLSDVFEIKIGKAGQIMNVAREELWKMIEATPSLDWLLLTKRPENVMRLVPAHWQQQLPANVWIGTTAGTQQSLEDRLPHLVKIPAVVRFLSMEPLLERIEIGLIGTTPAAWGVGYKAIHSLIDWIIVGGESGPRSRSAHLEWFAAIIAECVDTKVPVFFKQAGSKPMQQCQTCAGLDNPGFCIAYGGKDGHLIDRMLPVFTRHPKGGDLAELPKLLHVRQFPTQHRVDA